MAVPLIPLTTLYCHSIICVINRQCGDKSSNGSIYKLHSLVRDGGEGEGSGHRPCIVYRGGEGGARL